MNGLTKKHQSSSMESNWRLKMRSFPVLLHLSQKTGKGDVPQTIPGSSKDVFFCANWGTFRLSDSPKIHVLLGGRRNNCPCYKFERLWYYQHILMIQNKFNMVVHVHPFPRHPNTFSKTSFGAPQTYHPNTVNTSAGMTGCLRRDWWKHHLSNDQNPPVTFH